MITKLNFTDRTIKSYAIRKLTPKECFRLMGVRDNVIGTMQMTVASVMQRMKSVLGKCFPTVRFDKINHKEDVMLISASQQYKQAGNSIVVDVLAHIYEQLFYPAPPKPRPGKQLSLFDDLEDSLPDMPAAADKNEEKIFLTTFSGYDSQLMAADVLREWHPDFRWTCKGWSDIDKYACQMHNLVFPQFADCALGDITKIDWHEVKASRSVFKFEDISEKEARRLGLHEYPKIRFCDQSPIIGAKFSARQERAIRVLNARYGPLKGFRIYLLFFRNKPLSIADKQQSYWQGGNKNELVVCVGLDKQNRVTWSDAFSWCDSPVLAVKSRDWFMSHRLDLCTFAKYIEPIIAKEWKRKEFSDFKYLSVELSDKQYWIIIFLMLVLNVGLSVWIVRNGYRNTIH